MYKRSLIALLLAGSAQAQNLTGDPTFDLEPATGSIWISEGFFTQRSAVAEWRADGTIVGMRGPFSPFTYRSQRVPIDQAFANPMVVDGQFGIVADYRGFYARTDGGPWGVNDLFTQPGALGCHETPTTSGCLIVGSMVDARGIPAITVYNEAGEFHTVYRQNGVDRPAQGAELGLDKDNAFTQLGQIAWSPDGQQALNAAFFGAGGAAAAVSYKVYGADGTSTSRTMRFPTDAVFFLMHFGVRTNHLVAIMQTYYLSKTGTEQFGTAAYDLIDPFAAQPKLVPIANALPDANGPANAMGIDDTYFYYAQGDTLMATPMAGGSPVTLGACVGGAATVTDQSATASTDPLWIGCGQSLVRVGDGKIQATLPLTGRVMGGTALAGTASAYDIVLTLADGSFGRVRAGQDTTYARLLPLTAPPPLGLVWDDRDGVCGLEKGGTDIYCRVGDGWPVTHLNLAGVPQMVRRVGTSWWMATSGGNKRRLFTRPDGGDWALVSEWPGEGVIKLVRAGIDGLAIDLGAGPVEVATGSVGSGYDHIRGSSFVQPAISADGLYYDMCRETGPAGPQVIVCAVGADGSVNAVRGLPEGTAGDGAVFIALKRGVLLQASSTTFMIRGTKAIDLGHLYGDFLALPNQPLSLTVTEAGDGSVVIQKSVNDPNGNAPAQLAYYTLDGETLVPGAPAAAPHHQPDNSSGIMINIGSTASAALSDVPQVWRDADGMWRAIGPLGPEALTFGRAPLDALYSKENDAPDYVNDAVVFGDRVLAGTDDGIWSCPAANATPVTAALVELPQTKGCTRMAALPFVTRLGVSGDDLLAAQGTRILRLRDGATETLSSGPASHASFFGGGAAWTEGINLVTWDGGDARSVALPDGLGDVAAVAPGWACGKGGLFREVGSTWQAQPAVTPCLAVTRIGRDAFAVSGQTLYHCDSASCAAVATLPASFEPDGALGVSATDNHAVPTVALGSHLYQWNGVALNDVTPTYGRGSLLLSAVTHVNWPGIVSLDGGGMILLPTAKQGARHLRVE